MGAAVGLGVFFLSLESLGERWCGCRDFCCVWCG